MTRFRTFTLVSLSKSTLPQAQQSARATTLWLEWTESSGLHSMTFSWGMTTSTFFTVGPVVTG